MKIVIVGGGTAGWLSALFVSKVQKNSHDVTVIESTKIGIIGAGEGSTGHLKDIVNNHIWDFGCNEYEFMRECDATLKLGIKHRGWTNNIDQYYYGPIDGSSTAGDIPDVNFLHALGHEDKNKIHRSTPLGILVDEKRSTYFDETSTSTNHAYHFDAHKVGKYFKKICEKENVKHIDSEVKEVILKENGFIKSLKLDDGTEIEADFFIDATGFQRKLITALGGKWKSYEKHLPVNCALPFLVPYDKDEVIEPVTEAWAQKNGWCWNIPTLNRRGMGYVFCDKFITPEKAQEEIELSLGKKIEPIRVLKFDSGRLENVWIKNCLSIGLAASFSEPLEATSIHATIVQLTYFVFEYLRDTLADTYSEGTAKAYNRRVGHMYDTFMDFINVHYMGGREDSEFWKYIKTGETRTEFVSDLLDMCKHRSPNHSEFMGFYGYAGWSLWAYVLAGTGHLTPEIARKELDFYGKADEGKRIFTERHRGSTTMFSRLIDNTQFLNLVRNSINIQGEKKYGN
jgi:tryptophan halogenase